MSSKSSSIVLNYHDSIIYESDIELLNGPFWLNDTLIGFYLEYLEEEVYKEMNICFIRPEVAQCIKFSPKTELPVFLDPLKFRDCLCAIIPLNDCANPTSAGGSHWSLLVYNSYESCFYHIDSLQSSNYDHARLMAGKISQYLGKSGQPEFRAIPSLQQSNSYDCGVFVLCNIDRAIKHIITKKTLLGVDLMRDVEVSKKRRDLKSLILSLRK